jgi:hypothetical protein
VFIPTIKKENEPKSWAWWYIAVIPALRRLKLENHKFKASLYLVKPCLKKTKTKSLKDNLLR